MKKVKVKYEYYWWIGDKMELRFGTEISKKTFRRWLSKNEEYVNKERELRKIKKVYEKLYKKVFNKAVKYIKKKHPDATSFNAYIGIPKNSKNSERRLIIEFRLSNEWWASYRKWSFGRKRLPNLRADIKKLAELKTRIDELERQLNALRNKIVEDQVKKWILVVE